MTKKGVFVLVIFILLIASGVYFLLNKTATTEVANSGTYSFPTAADAPAPLSTPETPTIYELNNLPETNPEFTPEPAPTPTPAAPTPFPTPTPTTPAPTPTPVVVPTSHEINIDGFAFSPAELIIKKGDSVVWTNMDSAPHTVTGSGGGPASGTLGKSVKYTFKFNTVGSFTYHCNFHPSMSGKVIVE